MKSFQVNVENLVEAKLLLNALALYDLFQFENNVKPDYANAGGLNVYHPEFVNDGEDGFCTWYSDEGEDIDFYTLEQIRANPPEWEMDHQQ